MKPILFILGMVAGFSCFAQSDSLLFRSLERILKNEKGEGYKGEIFIAINKDDLNSLKIKDTTTIQAGDKTFKVILLKNPSDWKDFYVLPIGYHKDNYIVFNIQNCNRKIDKTYTISYSRNAENSFELDDFVEAKSLKVQNVRSEE